MKIPLEKNWGMNITEKPCSKSCPGARFSKLPITFLAQKLF